MLNVGQWLSFLLFLVEQNQRGRTSNCDCSQCNGSYSQHRAYINQDGDFVLSEDTLMSVISDTHAFLKTEGWYHQKFLQQMKQVGVTAVEQAAKKELVKIEYEVENDD